MFNLRMFSEKILNYEIYMFVPNSKNIEFIKILIAHIKYFIINDPTNNTSMMDWYKRKCEITVAYRRHRPSTFWKTVEKSGEIFHWKKRRLSE